MVSKEYIDGGDICKSCGDCCTTAYCSGVNGRISFLRLMCFDHYHKNISIKRATKQFTFDDKLLRFLVKLIKRDNYRIANKSCIMRIHRNGSYLCLLQARCGIEHKPKACQDYTCEKLRRKKKQPVKEALFIKW